MTDEQARAAFARWNALQEQQARDSQEADRLRNKFFCDLEDMNALENQWRAAWQKLGLY